MPFPTNPYTAGDPVGKTDAFVGRSDVLREVLRVLRHPTQNAITLYGQRRIGKTSILQYLELHLPEHGPYHTVLFDLMNKAGLPLPAILHDLGRTIAMHLGLPDPTPQETTERNFRESFLPGVLEALPEQASLVLLLDEFDVLADPEAESQSKKRFFGYMRDLRRLASERLQFVFVLGRNIDDLDIVARGLFKDLPAKRVSFLSPKDAEELVRLSERDGGLRWTKEAVAHIWELAAGHPYLTQALCSRVWEEAHDATDEPPPVRPDDVDAAVPATLEASHNMFEWLWGGLGPAEKVVASALAAAGPQPVDEDRLGDILTESGVRIVIGELRDAPRLLEQWDILVPADGGYRFRVELLRRWIVAHKPLGRTQEELDRINPVAESLFNAASGFYRGNNLERAESLLRQVLELNPNHLRAHELLAQILLAKGNLDEAQAWLEKLEGLAPTRARPRLKQVYLQRAEKATDDDERLQWYEKILAFFPNDPQATELRAEIYRRRAEQALQDEDYQAALEAYKQAKDEANIQRVNSIIHQREIESSLERIADLEERQEYLDAYEECRKLAEQYPDERALQNRLRKLRPFAELDQKYQQALDSLQQGNLSAARRHLLEVISLKLEYKQAIHHLYRIVTGEDTDALHTELETLRKQKENLEEKIVTLRERLTESTKLTRNLQRREERLKDENADLRRKLSESERVRAENIGLRAESERVRAENTDLMRRLTESENTLWLLQQQKERLENENSDLTDKLADLTDKLADVQEMLTSLQSQDKPGDAGLDLWLMWRVLWQHSRLLVSLRAHLSHRNPLDYLRLVWWVLWRPNRLLAYKKTYGHREFSRAKNQVGNRLVYTLSLWPLLLPLLGNSIGLLPHNGIAWQPWSSLWWALGLLTVWMILLLSDWDERKETALFVILMFSVVGGVACGMTVGITSGIAIGVAAGAVISVASGVAGGVAGDVAGVVAFIATGSIAGSITGGMASGIAAGSLSLVTAFIVAFIVAIIVAAIVRDSITVGFAGVALFIVAFVTASVVASGMASDATTVVMSNAVDVATSDIAGSVAGIVTGSVAATVANSVSKSIKGGKSSRLAFVLLALSGLVLAFFSSGGLVWLQTGTWPAPVWSL